MQPTSSRSSQVSFLWSWKWSFLVLQSVLYRGRAEPDRMLQEHLQLWKCLLPLTRCRSSVFQSVPCTLVHLSLHVMVYVFSVCATCCSVSLPNVQAQNATYISSPQLVQVVHFCLYRTHTHTRTHTLFSLPWRWSLAIPLLCSTIFALTFRPPRPPFIL